MTTCKQCREFEKCKDDAFINGAKFDPNESVKYCTGFDPITNADRIRAMSDNELATDLLDMFQDICDDGVPSKEWMLEWLKQPAE